MPVSDRAERCTPLATPLADASLLWSGPRSRAIHWNGKQPIHGKRGVTTMQINLTGQNIDITEPLRAYVMNKFDRIRRHFDSLIDIHVVLDVEKLSQHAEATINARGRAIFADAKDPDMYAAIDALIDKLDRQIIKHKEKLKDHHHTVPHKSMHLN